MKRILLLLTAVIGCQAADVTYPASIGTADTVQITGGTAGALTLPTDATKVKIGGGVIRAGNSVVVGTDPALGGMLRVGGSGHFKSADATNILQLTATNGNLSFYGYYNATFGSIINAYNTTGNAYIPLTIQASKIQMNGGPLVVGNDPNPGGSELLRVGGGISAKVPINSLGLSMYSTTTALQVYEDSDTPGWTRFRPSSGNGVMFSNNGDTPQLVIKESTGNVGIGTAAPGAPLEVKTRVSTGYPAIKVADYADASGVYLQSVGGGYYRGISANSYYYNSGYYRSDNTNSALINLEGGNVVFNLDSGLTPNTDFIPSERMRINASGNVTIGSFAGVTPAPTAKLAVNGTITAKEIKVTTSGADYVFDNDYKLRSLAEVEAFITEHKHLPEMMSAKAMQADGMPVSEVVTKQLAKIEELTLYAIKSDRERQAQADRLAALEKQVADISAANAQLTTSVQALLTHIEQAAAKK